LAREPDRMRLLGLMLVVVVGVSPAAADAAAAAEVPPDGPPLLLPERGLLIPASAAALAFMVRRSRLVDLHVRVVSDHVSDPIGGREIF